MRPLIASLLLCSLAFAPECSASSTNPPPGWPLVQALPQGTNIRVKTATRKSVCLVKAVDADTLSCLRPGQASADSFTRAEIVSVKLVRRGHSTAVAAGVGALIGAGTGVVIGAAVGDRAVGSKGVAILSLGIGLAVYGALIGLPVGYFSDLTAQTLYKR